jgi:hypothetical protein
VHHAPLDRALARIADEKGRPRWPALLDIFDDRRGFGEREIVVDQDRKRRRGLSAPNSAVFKSPASNDSVLRS